LRREKAIAPTLAAVAGIAGHARASQRAGPVFRPKLDASLSLFAFDDAEGYPVLLTLFLSPPAVIFWYSDLRHLFSSASGVRNANRWSPRKEIVLERDQSFTVLRFHLHPNGFGALAGAA
jgi:hypothetical protein